MAPKAIIFHGTGGRPDVCWYPWLGARLEARGFQVERPSYPTLNQEPIASFLPRVLRDHAFDEDTVLVGHSGGAALLLALLEALERPVAQAVLVAGYCRPPNRNAEPVLKDRYDWNQIRSRVRDLYFINSVTDPYGCDAAQGRIMFDELGGTQIVRDDGHFGSPEQAYPTFDLLDRLIGSPAVRA